MYHRAQCAAVKLEGIHHVTCITGDAPANVEFYAGTLGLRLVKKTVNQDDPTVYHLFYADERGSAGADITFFEYPGAPPGRAGDGMVHRVVFRVALGGGARLLGRARRRRTPVTVGPDPRPGGARARARRRRLGRRAARRRAPGDPRGARAPRLRRACAPTPRTTGAAPCSSGGSASRRAGSAAASGAAASTSTTTRPRRAGSPAAGRCTTSPGPRRWRTTRPGATRSPRSAGSRRPSSTASTSARSTSASRAECCSRSRRSGPGFTSDEPLETLGERLSLPPDYEQLRPELERRLTPLPSRAVIFAERPAAGEAEGAFVLVHGRGADEHDLLGLFDALDPERRLHGYSPRGPLSLPPGGAHWYAVPRVGYPDPETFAQGLRGARRLRRLAAVRPHRPRRLLAGRGDELRGRPRAWAVPRPAAVIAFSGFVPVVDGWELDASRPVPADRARPRHVRPGDPGRVRAPLAWSNCARRAPRCSTASRRSTTRSTRPSSPSSSRGSERPAKRERGALFAHLVEALLAEEPFVGVAALDRGRQGRVAVGFGALDQRRDELLPDALPRCGGRRRRSSPASPRPRSRSPGVVAGKSRYQAAPSGWPPSAAMSAVSPLRPQAST